jgi:cell division protein FtsI (penicillin-binding protein 3)
VGLVVRLVAVQVVDGTRYTAMSRSEVLQKVALPATRGTIYDREGNLLAVSVPRFDVVADDFLVAAPRAEAAALAPLLGDGVAPLAAELHEKNGYVVLARRVTPSVEARLSALDEPGVSFVDDDSRLDPGGSTFQPVLGGVNEPARVVQGDAGIELAYNSLLAGHAGSEVVPESPSGLVLPGKPTDVEPAEQGDGLVLTLDEPLQLEVTRDVEAEMETSHADSGIAVVMAVRTGAILAMVDLDRTPAGTIVPAGQNLAVTGVYQPGSVMKLATISFAIQDGLVTPSTVLTVPYAINVGGYTFEDADWHPTEQLTVAQILAQSSNVGTTEIAMRLGPQRLYDALTDLGYGKATSLDWPGQSSGILAPPSQWWASTLPTIAIGTGVAVTPLQILDAYTALANGGTSIAPHLVAATVSPSGAQRPVPIEPGRRLLDASTVRKLVPMFEGVIENGTAPCAQIPGYDVAGKTGTAQVPEASSLGYVPDDFNASFVGFVPAQHPELSGIVVLNHPTPIYGGSVAAPVFSEMMGYALRHFDVAPPPGPVVPQAPDAACASAQ